MTLGLTNDVKNSFIAAVTSATAWFAAFTTQEVISIVASIVLPIVFFSVGKYIDIRLQNRRDKNRE